MTACTWMKTKEEMLAAFEAPATEYPRLAVEPAGPASPDAPALSTPDRTPVTVRMSDVTPTKVEWLWPSRIPLGKLTMLSGEPDLGKSFITLDMAARVSRGAGWPDGHSGPVGGVVLLSAEDDLSDTVRPRLDAMGANVRNIQALTAVREKGKSGERVFDLTKDLATLGAVLDCAGTPRVSLVVIDPISAYLAGTDSNNNTAVRGVLAPLVVLAEKYRVAIVMVNHNRKSEGSAMQRSIGSIAFVAATRSTYTVVRDAEDPSGPRRLFLPLKNNLAQSDLGGLAFALEGGNGEMPRVQWEVDPVHITADEVAAASATGTMPRPKEKATVWLMELLAKGPVTAVEGHRAAEQHDPPFADRTVARARKELGVVSTQGAEGWTWSMPERSGTCIPTR